MIDESKWWRDDAPRSFAYDVGPYMTRTLVGGGTKLDAYYQACKKFKERLRDYLYSLYGDEKLHGVNLWRVYVPNWQTSEMNGTTLCARLMVDPRLDGVA